MSFFWVFLVTVSFHFVLATTENSEELFVTEDHSLKKGLSRVLTCISNNDDAALIWNYDLSAHAITNRFHNFKPLKPVKKKGRDCAICKSKKCSVSWTKKEGWTVVSSLKYPMAPVVDYRWEGFTEYILDQVPGKQEFQNALPINSPDGTLVFSIRGTRDIEIRLCNNDDLGTSSYVVIKIAVKGTRSVIENCLDEQPCDRRYAKLQHCSEKANVTHEAAILEAFEWRTFRLQWIGDGNMIKLFNDTDKNAFLQGRVKPWHSVSEILVKSYAAARFKFHNYNYSLATIPNAVLTTREFDHPETKFCIHMLVSLCPECQLNVILTESKNGKVVANTTIPENKDFYLNGLRTWRSTELKFNLPISPPTRIRFVVTTILNKVDRKNIWWALDNIYFCEGTELSSRKSTIELPISDPNNETPNIKCQKLIHNKILVTGLSPSEPTNSRNRTHPISRPTSSYPFGFTTSRNFDRALTNGRWYRDVIKNNENACLDLVTGQTYIKLVRNSNSQACGNYGGSLIGTLEEKGNAKKKQDFVCPSLQCTIGSDLKRYTKYNVIVKLRNGFTVLSKTVRTLEPAPRRIRNLQLESVFAGNVTGKWEPPEAGIGTIRYYTVTIKRIKLRGCADYEKETPPESEKRQNVTETMAFFTGLHPYAEYDFIVVANTVAPGPSKSRKFETKELDTPTANVSILRLIDGESRLAWEGLEDCTLITSSTKLVRLSFTGVSDWVQDENFTIDVPNKEYDFKNLILQPFTKYRVRAYYFRQKKLVNKNDYQELSWRTAPSKPPAVTELGTYELDNHTISVKWKPPSRANGVIESYRVLMMIGNKVHDNRSIGTSNENYNCELSPDHVCLEDFSLPSNIPTKIELKVFARNVNVTGDGAVEHCSFNIDDINKEEISHPENVTFEPPNNGIVTLKWMQPLFNPTKIVRYLIEAEILQTDLVNHPSLIIQTIDHPATQKNKKFSRELYLLASTKYRVSIRAVNYRNDNSNPTIMNISVSPSVAFANRQELLIEHNGTIAKLKVPGVVNGTRNTKVIVLVKGYGKCLQDISSYLSAITKGTDHFGKWMAAEYQVNHSEPAQLIFNVDEEYGEGNCSFHRQETYHFTVILVDWHSLGNSTIFDSLNSSPFTLTDEDIFDESSVLWLLGLSGLVICLILLFVWCMIHRKTRKGSDESHDLPLVNLMSSLDSSPGMERRIAHLYDAIDLPVSIKECGPNIATHEPNFYPVVREELEEYIKEALATRLLHSHWEMLPKSYPKPCKYGNLPENTLKNQCEEVIPYDDNRVILDKIGDDFYSDYINASYIQGHRKTNAYIATQGPKRDLKTKTDTVPDFWRMVWQKEVRVICMLTNVIENGQKKCEQYWPEVGKSMEYNDVFVLNIDDQVFTDYTISTLQLICPDGKREIKHFHYTEWPDHGVPKFVQSIAAFVKKLVATPVGDGPMVVHGYAGAGRTGTLILCDICLRQSVEEEVVNIPSVTLGMRQDRANMVDTMQQYLLAYFIIAECKILERTQISCTDRLKENIEELRKKVRADIHRLSEIGWQERALHALSAEYTIPIYAMPHKVLKTFESEKFSPVEPIKPSTSKSENDSFHATSVEGLRRREQYLVTRQLSPSTSPDFGSLVVKKKIELIVVLQRPKSDNIKKSSIMSDESGLYGFSNIQVENQSISTNKKYFTTEKLQLTDTSQDEPKGQSVTILTCIGWEGKEKPPPVAALVSLWIASENIKRKEGPTLVICCDGVTGCGLYLALSILLEQMSLDKECDVISAVRMVQRSNPNFVQSVEQIEYLYDAAVNYNANFSTYSHVS